jgi:hypothetical protein
MGAKITKAPLGGGALFGKKSLFLFDAEVHTWHHIFVCDTII